MARTLLFWLFALLTSATHATNLTDAVNAAQTYDAGISSARNARLAGREKLSQGVASLLPRAQIESNYTKQDQPNAAYAATVRRHGYTAGITQPLFDVPGFANFKRGKVLATQADVEFSRAQQELITLVSDSYFNVLYLREVLQATTAAEETFAKLLAQAQVALELGDGTVMDVTEAQANLDQAHATAVAAENDLEIESGKYTRLTGLLASEIQPTIGQCPPLNIPPDLPAAMQEASVNNVNVRIAELQLSQSRIDVAAAIGTSLPIVKLEASYGARWSRGANQNLLDQWLGTTSNTQSTTIGVTVTIPLFAGGAQLSVSREAYHRFNQARDSLEDARRSARESARAAYLNVRNGNALVRARKQAWASASNKVASTRLGHEVGLRSSLDELNALQRYFEAIRDLANAHYNQMRMRLQLSAAMGTLSDADLVGLPCH